MDLDYIKHVESAFGVLRGGFRPLTPEEWTIAEGWQREIPLKVVLWAFERLADVRERTRQTVPINSLAYCEEEVEAQWLEYLEMKVGSTE